MSQARDTTRKTQRRDSVRRAPIPALPYEQMSELGRDLYDLSREYEASGEMLLNEEEIESEVMRRRGGYSQEHAI